jgi:hypothetical protein
MSISITTDHLLLDDHGTTITARGYEISWLIESVSSDTGYEFYRKLLIERLSDGRTWHWTKKHGRWTTTMRGGDDVDGWQRVVRA